MLVSQFNIYTLQNETNTSVSDFYKNGLDPRVQVELLPAELMNVGQVSRSAGTASPHVFRARRKCRSPRACWEDPGCCLHNKSKPSGSTAAQSIQLHGFPTGGDAHRSACLDSLSNTRKTDLSSVTRDLCALPAQNTHSIHDIVCACFPLCLDHVEHLVKFFFLFLDHSKSPRKEI